MQSHNSSNTTRGWTIFSRSKSQRTPHADTPATSLTDVACDFAHGQLSGLLQNAEAIILKRSVWNARQKCDEAGWPIRLLNLVHDEVQIELLRDDEELAWKIGALFADEYRLTAEYYSLRCPFAGGVSVGKNWNASH